MASAAGPIDLYESQQPRLYAAYSVTYSLAVIAVCLRLISRKHLSKAGLWWDDYAICFSLVRGQNLCSKFLKSIFVRRG